MNADNSNIVLIKIGLCVENQRRKKKQKMDPCLLLVAHICRDDYKNQFRNSSSEAVVDTGMTFAKHMPHRIFSVCVSKAHKSENFKSNTLTAV